MMGFYLLQNGNAKQYLQQLKSEPAKIQQQAIVACL